MGQVSTAQGLTVSPTFNVPTVTGTKIAPAGYMGEFGTGLWSVFQTAGTYSFKVPTGISSIRVRVVGAGGSTNTTVPGGTSSFGALISATGGSSTTTWSAAEVATGGVGIGGDFQAVGGGSTPGTGIGGGGAGSQLGAGGKGTSAGGGGIAGDASEVISGVGLAGSPFGGFDITGLRPTDYGTNVVKGAINPISAVIRFPFDGFTGGGGETAATNYPDGGVGAGGGRTSGTSYAGRGGVGGGGGGQTGSSGGAPGGLGGGQGGTSSTRAPGGGGGYAHGVFTVTPGSVYTVTVGAGTPGVGGGGNGLVVVEF